MAINRRHDDLPTAKPSDGWAPDKNPRLGPAILKALLDPMLAEDDRPFATPGAEWRASWSGKCTRDLGYHMAGLPPSDPFDYASAWNLYLGRIVHEKVDEVIPGLWPNSKVEVPFRWEIERGGLTVIGGISSDASIEHPTGKLIALEVKTIGGFQFKARATPFKGAPTGPASNAVRQGAMAARAMGADELVVLVFAKENVSVREAQRHGLDEFGRFCAEWTLTPAQFMDLAEDEDRRILATKAALTSSGPDKVIPSVITDDGTEAIVTNSVTGQLVVDGQPAGTTWMCDYCANATRCRSTFGS